MRLNFPISLRHAGLEPDQDCVRETKDIPALEKSMSKVCTGYIYK